jgi:hypothetical protein
MILVENFICWLLAHGTPPTILFLILNPGLFKAAKCNLNAKENCALQLANYYRFIQIVKFCWG